MKKILATLIILTIFGCSLDDSGSEADGILNLTGAPVSVEAFKCLSNANQNITICLETVISDSRCPEGLDCNWEGDAEVRFVLNSGSASNSFTLHTSLNYLTQTTLYGYEVKLVGLYPEPQENVVIPTQDYYAIITVSSVY